VSQTVPVSAPHDVGNRERLLTGWVRHLGDLAPGVPQAELEAAGLDLLDRYAEPHRAYHDVTHLAEVLAAVELLAEHADDLPVVVAAAWWHDAVYDVTAGAGRNEEASARLAERTLTGWTAAGHAVDTGRAARVGDLVRMTAEHDAPAGDRDAEVLSDADLAVLAADPDRYARYAADVCREYEHVPEAAFAAGRAAVLRGLLAHDRLYRTAQGQARWEDRARANLARELAALH
jgi:predicted metal-dependent HD superfamily phosphohydrolase